jgi:hypothetical protein
VIGSRECFLSVKALGNKGMNKPYHVKGIPKNVCLPHVFMGSSMGKS